VVERLTEEARQQGLSLDSYLLETVLRQVTSGATPAAHPERARKREEAVLSIREHRAGNVLGADTTIRQLIDEGRRF
jgi:hypothetical protein